MTEHPAIRMATEAHVRLVLVEGSDHIHAAYCPNGWADVPAETSCGRPVLRQLQPTDHFDKGCEACATVDIQRHIAQGQ